MKKRDKIIYWIATIWLSLGMIATGILQVTKQFAEGALAPPGAGRIKQLGYPLLFPYYNRCLENSRCNCNSGSEIFFSKGMGLFRIFLSLVRSIIYTYRCWKSCKWTHPFIVSSNTDRAVMVLQACKQKNYFHSKKLDK